MTGGAGIGNIELNRQLRGDEPECVRAHIIIAQGLLNFWHVTGGTFACGTIFRVVRVFGYGALRARRTIGAMATQAKLVARDDQVRHVFVAVHVVTIEAAHVAVIHHALREIISLHPVLVGCAIGKVIEVLCAETVFLKSPFVREAFTRKKADGPIHNLTVSWNCGRAPLGVALHADVVCADKIQSRGVDDIFARGMLDMRAAWAMTFFTAHVPLGDLLRFQIIVERMATVAQRTCGPLEIARGVVGGPPIRAIRDVIWKPATVLDVPLRGENVIVIATLGEITLFPPAAVYECDLAEIEIHNGIGMGEISKDGFRMFFGVTDNV